MQFETKVELHNHTQLRHLMQSVLLFLAYYFVSDLGYLFVFSPEPASHFWPASGITLYFLLKVEPKNWLPYLIAIFAGEFAISIHNNLPLVVSVWWGIADTVEPALAASLITTIIKEPLDITHPKHLTWFLLICILTPISGAAIGSFASITWLGVPSFFETFRTWWFAIALGEILVTPFLITWFHRNTFRFSKDRFFEGLALLFLFFAISYLTFSSEVHGPTEYLYKNLMMYLVLPLFLWTVVRFGESGVFAGLLLVNMIAAYFTARGKGPFAFFSAPPLVRLLILQTYLSFVSLAILALTTFMKQRRRSEEQLNSIIENSTAIIYLKDLSGKYILMNKAYERIFNRNRKDVIGKNDVQVFGSLYGSVFRENDLKVIESKKALEFEESSDHHTYITVKFPLSDANGEPYAVCGISTDISAIKKASEELSKAIALRDDFIAIASHELRTPLTPLKLQIDLLRRYINQVAPDYMKSDELFKLIERSDKEIERLSGLVKNLLDVSKITHNNLEINRTECDLAEIVRKVVDQNRTEIQNSGSTIEMNIPNHMMGKWDVFRMEQVVTNLVTNAVKYGQGKPILIHLREINSKAILKVKDNGIGISKDYHTKIFGRFERAVPVTAYGGLGLGLFIVQQVVSAHHGQVFVESEEGKGAAFIVELPFS